MKAVNRTKWVIASRDAMVDYGGFGGFQFLDVEVAEINDSVQFTCTHVYLITTEAPVLKTSIEV